MTIGLLVAAASMDHHFVHRLLCICVADIGLFHGS